jgi:hypothetical protein
MRVEVSQTAIVSIAFQLAAAAAIAFIKINGAPVSWWWITVPLWLPPLVVGVVCAIISLPDLLRERPRH